MAGSDEQNTLLRSAAPAVDDVSVSLTEAGLLTKRTAEVAALYARYRNWSEVKRHWHDNRVHERGSRSSAQKIFRIIKRRLLAGASVLPPVTRLAELVDECPTEQAKAQLFYFYLIQEDNLFRFVLHELLRRQGVDRAEWDVSPKIVREVLSSFRYDNGSEIEYADSTLHRWAQGFRSVLRDIGVLKRPYDDKGTTPTIDFPPLHLGALYSWRTKGRAWPSHPIGWMYLFQPQSAKNVLLDRVRASDRWSVSQLRGQAVLTPVGTQNQVK
ncbi:BrxA family protein [Salisaeta longa]|uniref:BrxA family protein n=1 Tax=Salisaeta longa TaxID=503170 RepID=UPI000A01E5A7|nr:BrxA family protein [Salisaeta longa]